MSEAKKQANKGTDKVLENMTQRKQRPSPANMFFDDQETLDKDEASGEQNDTSGEKENSEETFWSNFGQKKEKVEDTHKRGTFLIRKDLLEEFNRLAEGQGKGFKTQAINYALENLIKEIKQNR